MGQIIIDVILVLQRKFTGHEYDDESELTYANARYYNQGIGKFLSQDPVYLSIGNNGLLKQKTGLKLEQYLANPQQMNSYVYANNNPIRIVDRNGEFAFLIPAIVTVLSNPAFVAGLAITAYSTLQATNHWGQGVGYMMEGDHQSANYHFDTSMGYQFKGLVGGTAMLMSGPGIMNEKSGSVKSNYKIELSKQNKHVVGSSNYKPELGKSLFTNKNPQKLLDNYSGKGQSVNNLSFGEAGYKEKVDFGVNIGTYINKDGTIGVPTTNGTIHYSKNGAHIVPAKPNFK